MLTLKKIALGVAFTSAVVAAKAQKTYKQGLMNYTITVNDQSVDAKGYFTPDSTAVSFAQGPAIIKTLSTNKNDYFAILVDVPVMGKKFAAVLTPGEIEEAGDSKPDYTFTPTTETKKIGDYNCKKYVAKDSKNLASGDVWMTNDIATTQTTITQSFATLPGVAVQFPVPAPGMKVVQIFTLKSISDEKAPAGTFGITPDFTRISYADLKTMSGRK